ncbi:EutN/CcmL family microcompartment protein [Calorimonas adulescens]|jgi:Ethanolamine utilisation protein EutN/carboxysome.|uniref:Ethanolamine utilization protein EutN n=1 Tax=Calorimonas adulescens TaxID=2606906 RepID=A0A5D8QEL3_9THEO|nr:EutN/CcmL family microcompartment protein [Calorimonas adulescens]TZE83005.1 ethanolamine utilization protein EutN [Calorimonas adulescens]
MFIAKVIGDVVSTKKDEKLIGYKLLIIQKLNVDGQCVDYPVVAVDMVGAGIGETVLVITGSSARYSAGEDNAPIDASIVGIIDYIEIDNAATNT